MRNDTSDRSIYPNELWRCPKQLPADEPKTVARYSSVDVEGWPWEYLISCAPVEQLLYAVCVHKATNCALCAIAARN